jgi:hypothetical protein
VLAGCFFEPRQQCACFLLHRGRRTCTGSVTFDTSECGDLLRCCNWRRVFFRRRFEDQRFCFGCASVPQLHLHHLSTPDFAAHVVRRVFLNGTIVSVAGNGTAGYTGNNLPGTSSMMNAPRSVASDGAGGFYVAGVLCPTARAAAFAATSTLFLAEPQNKATAAFGAGLLQMHHFSRWLGAARRVVTVEIKASLRWP